MRTAKNMQGIATSTIVIVAIAIMGIIKENISPMLAIILLILRRITFTSFREVLLRSRLRATSALDKSERKLDSIIQLIVCNVK